MKSGVFIVKKLSVTGNLSSDKDEVIFLCIGNTI